MRFLVHMQNPTRLPAKIKVSPSKKHANIDKNLEKIVKKWGPKKESFFLYIFLDFGPICGPPVVPKNAKVRKKACTKACQKKHKKNREDAQEDGGVGGNRWPGKASL